MRSCRGLATVGALLCTVIVPTGSAGERRAEAWRSLESPHYAVLSQLPDRATRAWAADFDVFIDSLSGLLGVREADLRPLTVVLFSPDTRAPAGCAVRADTWGVSGALRRGAEEGARASMLRAGTRWLIRGPKTAPPAWIETGLVELFATFEVRGGTVRWGEPMPGHLALLRERGLIPLRAFLADDAGERERTEDPRRFTAQAWALTHLLMLGGDADRRERFAAWLRRDVRSPGAGAALRAAFLGDLDGLQRDLEAYVDQPRLAYGMSPRGMVERRYRMTVANRPEVEAALGRLAQAPRPMPIVTAQR